MKKKNTCRRPSRGDGWRCSKRAVGAKAERVRTRWADPLDKVINDRVSKHKSIFGPKDANFVDILLYMFSRSMISQERI
jgi:hypothetical protein